MFTGSKHSGLPHCSCCKGQRDHTSGLLKQSLLEKEGDGDRESTVCGAPHTSLSLLSKREIGNTSSWLCTNKENCIRPRSGLPPPGQGGSRARIFPLWGESTDLHPCQPPANAIASNQESGPSPIAEGGGLFPLGGEGPGVLCTPSFTHVSNQLGKNQSPLKGTCNHPVAAAAACVGSARDSFATCRATLLGRLPLPCALPWLRAVQLDFLQPPQWCSSFSATQSLHPVASCRI